MEIPDAGKSKKEYIPGECNIGPEERRARRLAGKVGSGFTLVLWVVFLFTGQPGSHWIFAIGFPFLRRFWPERCI